MNRKSSLLVALLLAVAVPSLATAKGPSFCQKLEKFENESESLADQLHDLGIAGKGNEGIIDDSMCPVLVANAKDIDNTDFLVRIKNWANEEKHQRVAREASRIASAADKVREKIIQICTTNLRDRQVGEFPRSGIGKNTRKRFLEASQELNTQIHPERHDPDRTCLRRTRPQASGRTAGIPCGPQ